MKESSKQIFAELSRRYPELSDCSRDIERATEKMLYSVQNEGCIFTCGNGGSAADSEHIVGELMKGFRKKRPLEQKYRNRLAEYGSEGQILCDTLESGIRAISLTCESPLITAFSNDCSPVSVFAQQVSVLGNKGDVLLAISTSGNSENCVLAVIAARAKGMTTIALTGQKNSRLSSLADVCIQVPQTETYKVQELHLPIYHCICAVLENEIF